MQTLFDLLPFGQLFGENQFYAFTDYQLGPLADEARCNLLFWSLANVTTFMGQRAQELTLHYDNTFLWHYVVPACKIEIHNQLLEGHRIRFLSRCQLSQAKVEVEFQEIQLCSNDNSGYNFICTDSQIYAYLWRNHIWETNIVNWETNLVNLQTFHVPI